MIRRNQPRKRVHRPPIVRALKFVAGIALIGFSAMTVSVVLT